MLLSGERLLFGLCDPSPHGISNSVCSLMCCLKVFLAGGLMHHLNDGCAPGQRVFALSQQM